MKHHYIYFSLLLVLLVISLLMPFTVFEYDMERETHNGFDDGLTWIIFMLPTLLATILLLIRNYITAILGTCLYLGVLTLAGFMNYVMNHYRLMDKMGIGPSCVLVVALAASIISIIHTVKLIKNRKIKLNSNSDILDEMDF